MAIPTFWQKKVEYQLMTKGHQLELVIPSEKHPISRLFVLGQLLIFFLCLLLIPFIIASNWTWINTILGLLIFGLFSYLLWSQYQWLHWERYGKEVLKIDLREQSLLYFQEGLYPTDVIQGNLNDFTGFRWAPENEELVYATFYQGKWQDGRLCFWLGDRKYRFAIALDKEEAKRSLKALNTFLKSPNP